MYNFNQHKLVGVYLSKIKRYFKTKLIDELYNRLQNL